MVPTVSLAADPDPEPSPRRGLSWSFSSSAPAQFADAPIASRFVPKSNISLSPLSLYRDFRATISPAISSDEYKTARQIDKVRMILSCLERTSAGDKGERTATRKYLSLNTLKKCSITIRPRLRTSEDGVPRELCRHEREAFYRDVGMAVQNMVAAANCGLVIKMLPGKIRIEGPSFALLQMLENEDSPLAMLREGDFRMKVGVQPVFEYKQNMRGHKWSNDGGLQTG